MLKPKWKLRAALFLIAMGTAAVAASLTARPVHAAEAVLPAGTAQQKAVTACMECHGASILVQQRISKGAWLKEVEKMTRWGAVVAPEDKDLLVEYFSSNFPVDAAAYVPETTAGSPKLVGLKRVKK